MKRESVAKILIINNKNQALMLRTGIFRLKPEKSHKPDLPGGMVDPGESEHYAVIREAKEEASITLDPNDVTLGYAETLYYPKNNTSVSKLLYITRLDETPDVTISWEHEAYEWTDVRSFLNTHEMRPFYKKGIEYLIENKLV